MFDLNQTFDFIIHKADFVTVGSEWSKKHFPYPHHRLYFVTAGEAYLKLKDCDISLLPGFIYLLPSFSMVEAVCKESFSHYYIHFQDNSNTVKNIFEFYQPHTCIPSDEKTVTLYNVIIQHHTQHTPSSLLLSKGSLQLLLAPFFEGLQLLNPEMERFSVVLDFIREHYKEKIMIKTLSDLLDLDVVYFSNSFARIFGMPPSQYIINVRLEAAKRLLTFTGKKIREIALESGFENEMYFSRLFRQKTGVTPGEYRNT